jgi:hypothetical protein
VGTVAAIAGTVAHKGADKLVDHDNNDVSWGGAVMRAKPSDDELRNPFELRSHSRDRSKPVETPIGVFTLDAFVSSVETPSGQRLEYVKAFSNALELRRGARIETPDGVVDVATVRGRAFKRGREIAITGAGLAWTARRSGFMRAVLVDGTGQLLARRKGFGFHTLADGDLDEPTLALVIVLWASGVLTMTSRFEVTLNP